MSYLVVIDSCGELTPDMKASGHFMSAPLTMDVDQYHFVDDETFDQQEFLKRVRESPNCPRSACPSPQYYKECFDRDFDHLYAVTLSGALSGSYNSAQVGRTMALEEHPDKKIHVFNSKSASIGETLIAMKIAECEEAGMSFEEVVDTVETYIETQHTYFLLESLDMLEKAGRLGHLAAKLINTLNIKPVMGSTPEGNIQRLGQARGMKAAIGKMAEFMRANVEFPDERTLMISHCAAPDRAEYLKEKVLETGAFKDVIILETRGISTMYAGPGGLIMVV